MNHNSIISVIKNALENQSIYWKDHILQRMIQRKISVAEVTLVLSNCIIIEEYQDDKPFPSYLLAGFADENLYT